VQQAVRALIHAGLCHNAHDCSEGGIAVALAECCFTPEGPLGAEVQLSANGARPDAALFGESQSRILVTVAPAEKEAAMKMLNDSGVPATVIGVVGGERLRIAGAGAALEWRVADIYDDWFYAIERALGRQPAGRPAPTH